MRRGPLLFTGCLAGDTLEQIEAAMRKAMEVDGEKSPRFTKVTMVEGTEYGRPEVMTRCAFAGHTPKAYVRPPVAAGGPETFLIDLDFTSPEVGGYHASIYTGPKEQAEVRRRPASGQHSELVEIYVYESEIGIRQFNGHGKTLWWIFTKEPTIARKYQRR